MRATVYSIVTVALAACVTIAMPSVSYAQGTRNLELDVGEQTTVSAVGVERYSDGVPNVVEVRVTEREFVIVALRPGRTSLVLFYENGRQVTYRIQVRDPNAAVARPGSVEERENIRLDFYFVELNESYNHSIGLGFPGSIGGNTVGTGNFRLDFINANSPIPPVAQANLQLLNQVLPRLDIAQSSGWARLRRHTMLVTANGTPARLNTGGEVNFLVTAGLSAQIQSIEFGSMVEMTPRFDAQTGRIEIQIQADLSELTDSTVPNGPPGRRRTRLESVVNMQPGQAMMMSGLVSRSEAESQGGLPGLSQIPIFGVLFGTNERDGLATQNVVVVVPTVVQSVPRQQRDYIREAMETYQRFNGFIHTVEMFERVPPGYGRPGGRGAGGQGGGSAAPAEQ